MRTTRQFDARRLLSTSTFSLTAQALSLIATFILTPIQLRSMGAENYALVSLASATASYVLFFDVGGGYAVMRYVPLFRSQGRREAANEAFSVALIASLSVGLIGAAVLWLVAPTLALAFHAGVAGRIAAEKTIRISGLWLPPVLCSGVLNGAARGMGSFRLASALSAVSVVLFNVLWAAIALNGGPPQDVAVAQLVVSVMVVVTWTIVLILSFDAPRLRRPRDADLVRKVVSFSALSSVAMLGSLLLGAVGTVVIASGVGAASIVYYTLPLSIAQRLTLVSSTVTGIAFPHLSKDRSRDPKRNTELLRSSHTLITVASGGLAFILIWTGPSLLSLWISPGFSRHAAGPLRLLVIGFLIVSLSSIYQVHLEAVGRNLIVTILNLISGMAGLGLCFFLSRSLGATGGALGIATGLGLMGLTVIAASIVVEGAPEMADIWWTIRILLVLGVTAAAVHIGLVLAYDPHKVPSSVDLAVICAAVGCATTLLALDSTRRTPTRRHHFRRGLPKGRRP